MSAICNPALTTVRALYCGPPKVSKLSSGCVDRKDNVIRGYTVASVGPFKSEGRGEFDGQSLEQIVRLMAADPLGKPVHLQHSNVIDDRVGHFLGRAKNPRIEGRLRHGGKLKDAVVADLHLDPSSFRTPNGNIGEWLLRRAESDPASFSSSLVLQTSMEFRLDSRGRRLTGPQGEPLPPLWRPLAIHGSDVVREGDAVDSFLGKPQETLAEGTYRRLLQGHLDGWGWPHPGPWEVWRRKREIGLIQSRLNQRYETAVSNRHDLHRLVYCRKRRDDDWMNGY